MYCVLAAAFMACAAGFYFGLKADKPLRHRAMQAGEARFRELIEQASDGIFIADLDGRYTEVNSAGCQLLGYERNELIGKSIIDLIEPREIPRLWQSRQQLLEGKIQVDEWALLHRSGSYIPVEVSAKILADGRWQGIVRDIRARKKAQARLQQAAIVFDNTLEAIIIADSQRRIVAVNQAYTDITGYTADEVIGKNPGLHKSGRHSEAFYRQMWQALENVHQP